MEKVLLSEYLDAKMEHITDKIQESRNISDSANCAYYQGQLDLLMELNMYYRNSIEKLRVRSL